MVRFSLGFHKIGTDRWEFANEDFLRGKKSSLKNINRRRSSQVQQIGTQIGSSVEMGKSGMEGEVQKLRREKDLLMQEVVQLRQEHLMTVQQMDALKQRMQSAEVRQKHMVSFVAKVLQNPVFLGHLKQLKEQREIASMRVRRKFLKQQQQLPSQSESDKSTGQQIVKYRLGFKDASTSDSLLPGIAHAEGSASLLPGIEHGEDKRLPSHLLQDMVDKPGLDTGGQEFLGGSDESKDLKGKKLLSSQTDVSFTGTDYYIYLPKDITPEEMVSGDISPAGESFSRPDSKTFSFKEKNVMNIETDATAAGTEYPFLEGISQERMFPDTIAPASDCVGEEEIWNVGFEAGGSSLSSGHDVWDDLVCYGAQEMDVGAGSCSLWDLGLHTLEEDLDIDEYVGGESSFQEHKDDAGQLNEDCPKDSEP